MKKQKTFIIRYFMDDKFVKVSFITKKEAKHMMAVGILPTSIAENEADGIKIWFDLDITLRK